MSSGSDLDKLMTATLTLVTNFVVGQLHGLIAPKLQLSFACMLLCAPRCGRCPWFIQTLGEEGLLQLVADRERLTGKQEVILQHRFGPPIYEAIPKSGCRKLEPRWRLALLSSSLSSSPSSNSIHPPRASLGSQSNLLNSVPSTSATATADNKPNIYLFYLQTNQPTKRPSVAN